MLRGGREFLLYLRVLIEETYRISVEARVSHLLTDVVLSKNY